MKITLIACTLCFPLVAIAQVDICKCAENSRDESTGQRIVQSKFYTIGKNERSNSALLASVRRIDSVYYLYIISQLPGCTGDKTSVTFKLTDGKTIARSHIGEVDCGETVFVYDGIPYGSSSVIKILADDKTIRGGGLTGIRLHSTEKYANIKMAMPFNLKTIFDCVDKTFAGEAKSKPKQGIQN